MSGVVHEAVGEDEDGMRLDRWFKQHYPVLGFGHLQKLLRSGQIRIDGARAKGDARLRAGQTVRVPPLGAQDRAPSGPRSKIAAADIAFMEDLVLHRDKSVIALNKPSGLATQGGSGITRSIDGLLGALADAKGERPRLVHRLDRDTSGVLLVARTRKAAQALAGALKSKRVRKLYWALVKGVASPRQGEISTHLAPDPRTRGESQRVARHGDEGAVHALTRYTTLDQAGSKVSWVALAPITGRKHQLRVHMAHIGVPIIGDPRYLDIQNWEAPGGVDDRLHLHARSLEVPHPDGGVLALTAPMPAHITKAFELFGFDVKDGERELAELAPAMFARDRRS